LIGFYWWIHCSAPLIEAAGAAHFVHATNEAPRQAHFCRLRVPDLSTMSDLCLSLVARVLGLDASSLAFARPEAEAAVKAFTRDAG